MSVNPNTPVIVGVAQLQQRLQDPVAGKEPLLMMLDAVRGAAADAVGSKDGAANLLAAVDSVRVVRGIWRYRNPAGYLAEQCGVPGAETVGTCFGGNMVQSLVNQTALDILAGKNALVVLTGAENGYSLAKARKQGVTLPVTELQGTYQRLLGENKHMSSEHEQELGLIHPIQFYPLFESALRYQAGESLQDHQQRIAGLWAGFSQVASGNPDAWMQTRIDAEAIATESPGNRMVGAPYTKLMNSNNAVDMAAGLVMCSVARARQWGIPEAQWVYPWAGTDAQDHYFVSHRDNLHSSPAIRIAGQRLLEMTETSVAQLDYLDVYSCFPSAVQVAVAELGLDVSKPLTVTGGLTFGGGPLNNYVMHSIARMVELLRAAPASRGMITANGGFLTKHAFGLYAATPPKQDFQHEDVQAQVDATPRRVCSEDFVGEATIEAFTVMHDGTGPSQGIVACLSPAGERIWAVTQDTSLMAQMKQQECCGLIARIDKSGELAGIA